MKLNYPAIKTIADTRIAEAKIPTDAIATIFPVFKETDTVSNSVFESRFCCASICGRALTVELDLTFFAAKAFF